MDGIRNFFRAVKRIHFWLICGLVMLLSFAFWFMAVGKLDKEKKSRVTEYENLFNTVKQISGKDRIANDSVSSEMDNLIDQRRVEIKEAWDVKYAQQNSDEIGILTWPESLGGDANSAKAMARKIAWLRPIEKHEFPLPDTIDNKEVKLNIGQREDYKTYVLKELPKLAESIGAEWKAVSGSRSGGITERMPRQMNDISQNIVDWDPQNQGEILSKHFTWGGNGGGFQIEGGRRPSGGGGTESENPDTLQILYAQEDLWILRALMKVIADTNGDAQTQFNAAIKKIESISIGESAIVDFVNSPTRLSAVLSAEEEAEAAQAARGGMGRDREGGYGSEGGNPYSGNRDGGYGDGEMGEVGAGPDPAEGRYVDENYAPLSAEKLREVMTAESITPEDAYLLVSKRVPVRMRVSIDQKRLPELLLACGNSELTVEVREVRLNTSDQPSGFGGRRGGGGYGGDMGEGGFGDMGGRSRRGGGGLLNQSANAYPFDVTAEIYGIIYLFNPVDNLALGIEEESTDEEVDPDSVTNNSTSSTRS